MIITYTLATDKDVPWMVETCRGFTAYHLKEEYEEWVSDSRNLVVVAWYEGNRIGYTLLIRQSNSWMMVETLFVQPEYRKCGVATGLLTFSRKNLPLGVNFLTAQVDMEHLGTLAAIKRLGFAEGPPHRWAYIEMETKHSPGRTTNDV